MVNNRYGVCIRMALGYCSIEWSQVDRFSFSVSGDTGSFDPDIIGKSQSLVANNPQRELVNLANKYAIILEKYFTQHE